MVGVDARLGEHCDFFLFRWENLGGPPPYRDFSYTLKFELVTKPDRLTLRVRTTQTMRKKVRLHIINGAQYVELDVLQAWM